MIHRGEGNWEGSNRYGIVTCQTCPDHWMRKPEPDTASTLTMVLFCLEYVYFHLSVHLGFIFYEIRVKNHVRET